MYLDTSKTIKIHWKYTFSQKTKMNYNLMVNSQGFVALIYIMCENYWAFVNAIGAFINH